jgi:hypothetical protein
VKQDDDVGTLIQWGRADVDLGNPPELEFRLLDNFLRHYKAEYDAAIDPDLRRRALSGLIFCLAALVNNHEPWRRAGLAAPLRQLILAFDSLDEGAVEPLLGPSRAASGGRPRGQSWLRVRAFGAAASAILMRGGWTEGDADKWAGGKIRAAGYSLRGTRITAGTVKGWRKECREAPADNRLRVIYDDLLREVADAEIPSDVSCDKAAKYWATRVLNTLFGMDEKSRSA